MTPVEYIDAAKARANITSDRKLADAIGMSQSTIAFVRSGRMLPSESTIVKLADLAGIDRSTALLDLVLSKATDPQVRTTWESLRQNIVKGAAVTALVVGSALPSPAANAGATSGRDIQNAIYYHKSTRRNRAAQGRKFATRPQENLRRTKGIYIRNTGVCLGPTTRFARLGHHTPRQAGTVVP